MQAWSMEVVGTTTTVAVAKKYLKMQQTYPVPREDKTGKISLKIVKKAFL